MRNCDVIRFYFNSEIRKRVFGVRSATYKLTKKLMFNTYHYMRSIFSHSD